MSVSRWIKERLITRLAGPLSGILYGLDGINIPDADWDNLIILDACRADLFEDVADLSEFDDYRRVRSIASSTKPWLEKNWTGDHYDTTYVTVHGRVAQTVGENFYKLVEPWRDYETENARYPPELVTDAAIDSYSEDKRLVAHYLQPHHPFLDWKDFEFDDTGNSAVQYTPWGALRDGVRSHEEVWEAYGANLSRALTSVENLLSEIEGRTIITADHGNFLGERAWPLPIRAYGHPPGQRHPAVTSVPWAVIAGERRETNSSDSGESKVINEDISDQLRALGYSE